MPPIHPAKENSTSDLERYRIDVRNGHVSGEYFLSPDPQETRTPWYDEYFDHTDCLFEDVTIHDIYAVSDADFRNCTFRNCTFLWGSLSAIVFSNCTIESLTFKDTEISCSFENSTVGALHFYNGLETR